MLKGEYIFKVRSYECGADGFASLPSICNYLQEAASLNAEELGFSKSNFDAQGGNISWVLTRLAIKMKRYPAWEEPITVVTFPRGGRKIVAWRDFEIKSSDGETIGLATSEWMLIDLATRKIVSIPESVLNACEFGLESVLGAEPFTARLKFPADAPVEEQFAPKMMTLPVLVYRDPQPWHLCIQIPHKDISHHSKEIL